MARAAIWAACLLALAAGTAAAPFAVTNCGTGGVWRGYPSLQPVCQLIWRLACSAVVVLRHARAAPAAWLTQQYPPLGMVPLPVCRAQPFHPLAPVTLQAT